MLGLPDADIDEIEEFLTGVRPARDPNRVLAAVLFTDIVGSTAKAAELGDAKWSELLASHEERAKAEVDRHGGTYIDSTGDGLFATFDGPARAVRCAQAIGLAVGDLGLEIRAGVHTGEVELAAEHVRGIAVHIGARVAALAGPSEVLTSQTVKDLTAGSGLIFEDAGEQELKGVPDRWHLYRVVK
jgi:class 3 adenylate cyclase